MIRVPITTIWAKSHDCIWVQFCKDVFELVGYGLHVLSRRTGNRANFAVIQIEENWWIDAKLSAGTDRFFTPNFGKPFARRNS